MKVILFTFIFLWFASASEVDSYLELFDDVDDEEYMLKGVFKAANHFKTRLAQATDLAKSAIAEHGETIADAMGGTKNIADTVQTATFGASLITAAIPAVGPAVSAGLLQASLTAGTTSTVLNAIEKGTKAEVKTAQTYNTARKEGKSYEEAQFRSGLTRGVETIKVTGKLLVDEGLKKATAGVSEKIGLKSLTDKVGEGVTKDIQKKLGDRFSQDFKDKFSKEVSDRVTGKINDVTIGKIKGGIKDSAYNAIDTTFAPSGKSIGQRAVDIGKNTAQNLGKAVVETVDGFSPVPKGPFKKFRQKLQDSKQVVQNIGESIKNKDMKGVGKGLGQVGIGAIKTVTGMEDKQIKAFGKIGKFALKRDLENRLSLGDKQINDIKQGGRAIKQLFTKGSNKMEALKQINKGARTVAMAHVSALMPITPGMVRRAKRNLDKFGQTELGKGLKSDFKAAGKKVGKVAKTYAKATLLATPLAPLVIRGAVKNGIKNAKAAKAERKAARAERKAARAAKKEAKAKK